ncbi:hypothetical protein [Phenylobacterium sp.]|uniref:hypothetical protein n=1 Tax=Phenylobacterium sp. TaxID=1871053 RepID=UPI0028117F80|nr:hypothetical protein [Phenylobacterium sp.]
MSVKTRLKSIAERAPAPLARLLAYVPFSVRLGPGYVRTLRLAAGMTSARACDVRAWAFPKLKAIVRRAYEETAFYRAFYDARGYDPSRLRTFEHFQDIPIVTKADLREFGLEDRSTPAPRRMLINTGGTSGQPLAFHVDGEAFAREWAHMHLIWGRAGYHYRDLKLTMRGRNLGGDVLRYNAVHNEYIINTYADRSAVADALYELLKRRRIQWIHGYPSIVSEIISSLADIRPEAMRGLQRNLKGVLLGSEFPAPHYVEPLKRTLGVQMTAWYGHSEMCVLAYEDASNHYVPLHSYGFVEALDGSDGQRLIGTSYWNTASPFIRYDTGDLVQAEVRDGVVESFAVAAGRTGDFVIDGRGMRIALTALIFGRHHPAFDRCRHVQVRQVQPGKLELLVVPGDKTVGIPEIMSGFDFSNVELKVSPVLLSEPVRSEAGKIRLLV